MNNIDFYFGTTMGTGTASEIEEQYINQRTLYYRVWKPPQQWQALIKTMSRVKDNQFCQKLGRWFYAGSPILVAILEAIRDIVGYCKCDNTTTHCKCSCPVKATQIPLISRVFKNEWVRLNTNFQQVIIKDGDCTNCLKPHFVNIFTMDRKVIKYGNLITWEQVRKDTEILGITSPFHRKIKINHQYTRPELYPYGPLFTQACQTIAQATKRGSRWRLMDQDTRRQLEPINRCYHCNRRAGLWMYDKRSQRPSQHYRLHRKDMVHYQRS